MKILFVSNLFPPHFIGGYEIAAQDTATILNENNHECFVLASDYVKEGIDIVSEKTVMRKLKLHEAWGKRYNSLSATEISKYNATVLEGVIESVKPDVVYFWNIYGLGIKIIKLVKDKKIPYTMHFCDLSILSYQSTPRSVISKILHPTMREICDLNSLISDSVSISRYVKNKLKKYCSKDSNVIYPYLSDRNLNVKKEYLIGTNIKSVYIGQIEKHKGIQTVCEAINKLNSGQNKFHLSLDIYGSSLSNLDTDLLNNYGSFLKVHTGVPRNEILNRLSTYDLGFFPSIWEEPFGIAQIELMQAGLPIFATGMGGSCEPLKNDNHIHFKKGDAEDLKLKLAQFLQTYNDKARQIGQIAAKDIKDIFSKQNYIVALNAHFEKLVKSYLKGK